MRVISVTKNRISRQIQAQDYKSFSVNAGLGLVYLNGVVNYNRKSQTITSDYTANEFEELVLVNATSGNITVRLPNAITHKEAQYTIKKIDSTSNTITVQSVISGQKIDDSSSHILTEQYQFATYQSDGNNYFIVSAG